MNTTRIALFVAWFFGSLVVAGVGLTFSHLKNPAAEPLISNQQHTKSSATTPSVTQTEPGDCLVSAKYPAEILRWCDQISSHARASDLPPDLVAAVMLVESGGDPRALSRNGAVGLLQVMPRDGVAAGFQCPNGPCFASRPTIAELEDPDFNLGYGTRLLASLAGGADDLRQALYHYGPIEVGYEYADTVLAVWKKYE